MRRLGVYGANLPTKKERSVEPADFSVAGLLGFFDRKYDKPIRVTSDVEAKAIFGEQNNKNYYGWDCLNGFFANLRGTSGSIYVHSPHNSSAIPSDFVIHGGSPTRSLLQCVSAYQGELDYGDFGNRTGFRITETALAETIVNNLVASGSNSPYTFTITVDGCTGFYVGDLVRIHYHFGTTNTTTVAKITSVSETNKAIVCESLIDWGVNWEADRVSRIAYNIVTYRKSESGLITEVDKTIGNTPVTFNPNDPANFAENVFTQSSYLKLRVYESAIDLLYYHIIVSPSIRWLSNGVSPDVDVNDIDQYYKAFDSLPIRMLACCETANTEKQIALEQYCRNREDNPIAVLVAQYGLNTKQSMMLAGNNFQRSDEVDALFVGNWLGVSDPFSTSPTAKDREIPCVGHVMGEWIYSITQNGIHSSPARKNCPIVGVNSVLGYTAENDLDRTDLAEMGVNVIQKMRGKGFILRNAFTPSTAKEFRYSNAVIQRNYIKISCIESLEDSENTPNTIGNVREDRMAVLQFMNKLWRSGSNGSVKEGETFGQYEKDDGSVSTTEDAFEVIADASNNSVATLQAGERNIDIWFMFPAPAGSIKVGVGLIYKTTA